MPGLNARILESQRQTTAQELKRFRDGAQLSDVAIIGLFEAHIELIERAKEAVRKLDDATLTADRLQGRLDRLVTCR